MPGRPPSCTEEEVVGQVASTATPRKYGLARVCRLWDLPCTAVYFRRHRRAIPVEQRSEPRKRGPLGACSDAEFVGHIRRILAESPFHGEADRKISARPRYQGIRISKDRIQRLLPKRGLQAPYWVGLPHGPRDHDSTILTYQFDAMWGTDSTTNVTTEEGQVFVAVDHYTDLP